MGVRIEISSTSKILSKEKAEILGFLAAEGELHKRQYLRKANDRKRLRIQKVSNVYFTNTEPVLIKKFQEDCKSVYNIIPYYDNKKKDV